MFHLLGQPTKVVIELSRANFVTRHLLRVKEMPMLKTGWVSCTPKVKVWMKITREQQNITSQHIAGNG
jgi:hypothetical protein